MMNYKRKTMKKLIKISLTTVVLVCAFNPLYAGGSHDHGHGHSHTKEIVTKADIQRTAKQQLARLIRNKKINKSWSNMSISNMKKKQFNRNTEWVVSFENMEIKDNTKQTLYIFISLYGEVTGANYSGK